MTLTVQGEVEKISYENEETGFRVVRLGQVSGLTEHRQLTLVGTMPPLGPGTKVRAAGKLEQHNKHGLRFVVQSVIIIAPDTLAGLEKFLASGVLAGIGESLAKRLVKYFGLDTLRVLDEESHRLFEVPGLGKKKVEQVRQSWVEHKLTSNLLLLLQRHGISGHLTKKIAEQFGERAAEIVQRHPYRLALQVSGIGFKTADQIARESGLLPTDPERAQAGLLHQLLSARDQGHCYCDRELLLIKTADLLGIDQSYVEPGFDQLWASGRIVVEGENVFLDVLYAALKRLVEKGASLLNEPSAAVSGWQERLGDFEQRAQLQLADAQRHAVRAACEHKFVVVTGGPGVGKTTLVKALIEVLGGRQVRIKLAAPTGRAAQRLAESTAHPALTLHRLLEVGHGGGKFGRNAEHPLECDVLVIDESSMIDLELADAVLQAVPLVARVVLVGDADQLPSVGPGAVLLELIESGVVPVVRLNQVFRQGGESGIVECSHRILAGELPETKQQGDFFVIRTASHERCLSTVEELVSKRMAQRFGLHPMRDIQVLCPMHRGPVGTTQINHMLQRVLNPQRTGIKVGDTDFLLGDKVIQLKNDYDRQVFNGDVGQIEAVDIEAHSLDVCFSGEDGPRVIKYERAHLAQLSLAYCLSVHKSQGSEYPAVVVVLLKSHFLMLSRNLLYTAVTRAKRLCVVVTDDRALQIALSETRREVRATGLAERLKHAVHAPT